MPKRKNMVKNIVMPINDRIGKGLLLNISYDEFVLGTRVTLYKKYFTESIEFDEPEKWECLSCIKNKVEIELWCRNEIIENICCRQSCIFKGHELIKMKYTLFLKLIQEIPVGYEKVYVPGKLKGQNQYVYDFEQSGLQVWVWRNLIRTVIIGKTGTE